MNFRKIKNFILIVFSGLMIFGMPLSSVYGHGPEGHSENSFTNYDAIKKSMILFDKLLQNKKLDKGWEINILNIEVNRKSGQKTKDIIVKISRLEGTPEALYIFFDERGKYKGSNFKGE